MRYPRRSSTWNRRCAPWGRALGGMAVALMASVVGGCGGDERGPYPLDVGRERAQPDRRAPADPSALARLPVRDAFGRPLLVGTLPPGWQAQPASQMRAISVRIPGGTAQDDGDLSVSWAGGDVLSNVNRWRGQLGVKPLEGEALQALPRANLLEAPAVRVEARGRYDGGMGGGAPREGYALLGLVSMLPGEQRLFVKLVGPTALVDAQRAAFDAYVASLYQAGQAPSAPTDGAGGSLPPAPPAAPRTGLDPARLTWDLPPGWRAEKPRSMMRIMDFRVEGAPGTEGVLFQLSGDGGGLDLNINRWRGQMGQPELTADELKALARVPMLGREATWVEIPGTYSGMSGERVEGALFVGVVCLLGEDALFFRLVGPQAEVERERDALKALLASLKAGT